MVRKLSNRQHRFVNVYCDKEKKCARIEYDHNIKMQGNFTIHCIF